MLRTKILEAWAVLRILNWNRMTNAFKTLFFYQWGLINKKVYLKHQPYALSIEPTSICNLKCPECPTGTNSLTRPRGCMPLGTYKNILNHLPKEVMYLNLYIQGEPTIHPDFALMIKLAAQKNLYTSTSTNGHFITSKLAREIVDAGLTRIIFSVDGTTQESYSQYRAGGKLSTVINSIKHLNEAKQTAGKQFPLLIIQFLVFEHNEHEINQIKLLSRQLNADKLELKTAQFNEYINTSVFPPKDSRFSRYEKEHQLKIKGKLLNKCWRQWHSAVITWDGQMAPCCYDKNADHQMGNLNTQSLPQIWKGTANMKFKNIVFSNKKKIDICHNCPEGRSY